MRPAAPNRHAGSPNAPEIEYKKMVGAACPWQYLPGWARHLAIPDQPDLGLLGLNYLQNFRMDMNTEAGTLLLEPR